MQLTKNFSWDEMKCPCCNNCIMDPSFLYKLQRVRTDFGPMKISSAYRCSKRNSEIGGVENSKHCLGIAADVAVKNPVDKFNLVKLAIIHGFTNIGVYDRHVHLDTRVGPNRMWAGVSK